MALHRDIYWVGRQWAVTGFGVQAVDQRLKGAFDIEVAHLWDDDLPQRMRALAWLKADDFDKALDIARARHPEPPRKNLPLVESVLEMIPPGGRGEASKPPASPIAASLPASESLSPSLSRIEVIAPPSDPQKPAASSIERTAPQKPPAAPLPASVPASKPTTRLGTVAKPAPPPAAPPKPPVAPIEGSVSVSQPKPLVATPVEASVQVSKPSKRLVAVIEPAIPPTAPSKPVAAPVETKVTASKPAAIEQSPAKFQPLALRIEHASAKFLPRWRVRQ